MGIISAIGIGLLAGKAGQQFIFNYTKQEYEERIAQLEPLIAKLEENYLRLDEYRRQIPSFWEDEAAAKAHMLLSEEMLKVRHDTDWAKDTVQVLKETVQELDGKQDLLGELLENLMGMNKTLQV